MLVLLSGAQQHRAPPAAVQCSVAAQASGHNLTKTHYHKANLQGACVSGWQSRAKTKPCPAPCLLKHTKPYLSAIAAELISRCGIFIARRGRLLATVAAAAAAAPPLLLLLSPPPSSPPAPAAASEGVVVVPPPPPPGCCCCWESAPAPAADCCCWGVSVGRPLNCASSSTPVVYAHVLNACDHATKKCEGRQIKLDMCRIARQS